MPIEAILLLAGVAGVLVLASVIGGVLKARAGGEPSPRSTT